MGYTKSTDHLPTDQPTHRPTNPKITDFLSRLYFKGLIIKKYFTEYKHSWENVKL